MVKNTTKTTKKVPATKAKKVVVRQDTDEDPLFLRETVVAVPGRENGLNFKLVKVIPF